MNSGDFAGHEAAAADYREVFSLQALYGEIIDAMVCRPGEAEPSALRAVFLPDAVIDFPGLLGQFKGLDAIGALFGTALPAQLTWMWHSFGSPFVEVDADRATARWTLYSLAISRGGEGRPPEAIYGRYANTYVRTAAGWRQSSLLFTNETRSPGASHLGSMVRTQFDRSVPASTVEIQR